MGTGTFIKAAQEISIPEYSANIRHGCKLQCAIQHWRVMYCVHYIRQLYITCTLHYSIAVVCTYITVQLYCTCTVQYCLGWSAGLAAVWTVCKEFSPFRQTCISIDHHCEH